MFEWNVWEKIDFLQIYLNYFGKILLKNWITHFIYIYMGDLLPTNIIKRYKK